MKRISKTLFFSISILLFSCAISIPGRKPRHFFDYGHPLTQEEKDSISKSPVTILLLQMPNDFIINSSAPYIYKINN